MWKRIVSESGHMFDKDYDYNRLCNKYSFPIDITHRFLSSLKGIGIEVGLLTNIWGNMLQQSFDCGLIPKFEYKTIIASCEVGAVKPENMIYEIAEEKSGYSGGEILFVDDSPDNIRVAESFGWKGVLMDLGNPGKFIKKIASILDG